METATLPSDVAGTAPSAAEQLFAGPGEMRARCRAFDWATTPLGPVETWPAALRAAVRLCLDCARPMCVFGGPELVHVYNDAYAAAVGAVRHPHALGRPAREVWADIWDQIGPEYAQVMAGGPAIVRDDDGRYVVDRGRGLEETYWTYATSPIRDDDGRVVGCHTLITETSARVRADAALRESEARLRRVLDGMGEGFGLLAPDFTILEHNREALRMDGRAREEIVGRSHWDAFPGSETSELGRLLKKAMAERVPESLEHRYAWEEGRALWLEMRAYPTSDGSLAVFWRDVTARVNSEAALRESEAKYRTVFESIDEGFCVIEVLFDEDRPVDYRFLETNRAFIEQTGLTDAVGRRMRELAPAHEQHWFDIYGRVARTGEPTRFQAPAMALGKRWYDVYAFRLGEAGANRVAILFTDIAERKRAEAALRASEERYRLIVEGARDYVIFTTDPEGRIESWSPGAESVFGWTAAEAVGKPFDTTFVLADRARGDPERELVTARERGVAPDVRWHQRKDGTHVFVEGSTRALRDDAGRLRGFLKVGQDVTRQRALDEALRETRRRLEEALTTARMAYWDWSSETSRTVASAATSELVGLLPGETFTGSEQVFALVHPEDRERYQALVEEAGARGEGWRAEFRIIRPRDGQVAWLEERATVTHDPVTGKTHTMGLVWDVTARKLAEAATDLERSHRERDALRQRLTAAEEEERRRLSREVHDEAAQHLTALGLGLQALADVAPPASEVDRRVAALRVVVDLLGQELHAIAVRLRPKSLDDFGLEAALATYVEEWSQRSGIAVSFHARLGAERLGDGVESAVYRIVQEALTNVAKHSGATHASLLAERREDTVHVIVEDNGQGFDTDSLGERGRDAPGLGLVGARERATLLGGSVEIESAPGSGTTMFVRIPIEGTAGTTRAGGARATTVGAAGDG